MIHPLIFAIALVDGLAVALLLAAALRAERVLRGWAPGEATRDQLALERGLEAASLFGRAATLLLGFGTVGFVLAVASVLPDLVPGAMCGTGVVEATDGLAGRALTVRALAMLGLAGWWTLDRLDRAAPRAPLAPLVALALVVATPLTAWAVVDGARTLWSLDTHQAVDCCAAIYAEAGAMAGAEAGFDASQIAEGFFAAGAVGLIVLGLALGLRPPKSAALRYLVAGLAVAWTPVAGHVLVQRLAAYHYEVLAHHCPWCLFLPEHGAVGYVLFGSLAGVALEGLALAAATFGAGTSAEVADPARARARAAGTRIALAVAVFLVAALGPAIAWYWRFGVWMHG